MNGVYCPICDTEVVTTADIGDRARLTCTECGEVFEAVTPEPADDSTFADAETPFAENH